MTTSLDQIEATVEAGGRLTGADIDVLFDMDLLDLGALADQCRRIRHGDRVTFVRVTQVSATSGPNMPIDVPPGANEVRLVGCPSDADDALALTRRLVSLAGSVPVTGFVLDELAEMCGSDPGRLDELLAQLVDAGLSSIAEACVDRMDDTRWLEVASRTGLPVARLTVAAPSVPPVSMARRVAEWGTAVAGVRAFAPLTRTIGPNPSTGYEDVRQVALARLLVDNIDSIQVDWMLYGPKLAQVALTFGADDVDGISALDSLEHGRRRTPVEEITRNITAAAFVPVQRNGRFETVPALR